MKKKLIIDLMLFISMLLEFSRMYMPTIIHEIIGILLVILVTIHLILNKKYLINITKAKYNLNKTIMLIINILFAISFIITTLFGLLSSQDLLTILNIGNLTIIKLHKIFAYISLVTMSLHIGVNFNYIFGKIKNKIIKNMISILLIISGIYSFVNVDFFNHLIGNYGFGAVTNNIFINTLDYLLIVLMLAIIMHYIYEKTRKGKKNER